MTEHPARDKMSSETRELLGELTREDVETLKAGLPIVRAVIGFGRVTKWLTIFLVGLLAGAVLLGESVMKLISWLKPPN